jgi:hypothetical protein
MTSYAASLPLLLLLFVIMVIVCASLIWYALRTKGDVSTELPRQNDFPQDKRPT